ncbi:MAG TPA: class I SAM-dependent methyltransferase [Solirubrobacteraceae bacterium]|nr:class I SAM-dependent methyltransferase [Solirubrobacteraceae bacterium]
MTRDAAMRGYYDARAAEYDDWWLGAGLFAQRDRPGWEEDRDALIATLTALPPARTLDVACGTAFLTRHLRGFVVGVDQSPRMVEIAQSRLPEGLALAGDAFALPFADGAFDRVLAGHFYGHLREEEREPFLREASRVAPELIVVDSAGEDREEWQERRLSDGSRRRVFKRWFTAEGLAAELSGSVLHAGRWFVAVLSRRSGS